MEASWSRLGAVLGASLGSSWGFLGLSWGRLERLGGFLGRHVGVLGASSGYLVPDFQSKGG